MHTSGEENGIGGEGCAVHVAAKERENVGAVAGQVRHAETRRVRKEVIDDVDVRLFKAPPASVLSRLLASVT